MSSPPNNSQSQPSAANGILRIALLGAGLVGTALATQLASAGYKVSLSNSRGRETLFEEAERTGAEALDMEPAIAQAQVIVLAVPLSSISRIRPTLEATMQPGTTVIDAGNYYPSRDGRIEALDKGMPDSVWVSETLGLPVVKAFNNIVAPNIATNARERGAPDRSALPVAADGDEHLAAVMRLVDAVGFDPYEAGSLSESWRQQPGQPAYCTEPSLEMLPTLLHSAVSLEKAGRARDKARAMLERLPSDFSPQALTRLSRFNAGMDRWKPQSWIAVGQLASALVRSPRKQSG